MSNSDDKLRLTELLSSWSASLSAQAMMQAELDAHIKHLQLLQTNWGNHILDQRRHFNECYRMAANLENPPTPPDPTSLFKQPASHPVSVQLEYPTLLAHFTPLTEEEISKAIPVADWVAAVREEGLVDDDGHGWLATDGYISDIRVVPSSMQELQQVFPAWVTHIVWYNH